MSRAGLEPGPFDQVSSAQTNHHDLVESHLCMFGDSIDYLSKQKLKCPNLCLLIMIIIFFSLRFLQSGQKEKGEHDEWRKSVHCLWTNSYESTRIWFYRYTEWHEVSETSHRKPYYMSRCSVWKLMITNRQKSCVWFTNVMSHKFRWLDITCVRFLRCYWFCCILDYAWIVWKKDKAQCGRVPHFEKHYNVKARLLCWRCQTDIYQVGSFGHADVTWLENASNLDK